MNRKIVSGILLTLTSTSCIGVNQKGIKNNNLPNIIFIMSDDHAYQAISAYNPDLIDTPNIDKIAKEGVLLGQAYVTNSISGPSRAVILTGKYSHLNGFQNNSDNFDGDQQTLPKLMRAHGYQTALVGKWHLKSTPQGFDYWNILPGQGNYYNPEFIKMGRDALPALSDIKQMIDVREDKKIKTSPLWKAGHDIIIAKRLLHKLTE